MVRVKCLIPFSFNQDVALCKALAVPTVGWIVGVLLGNTGRRLLAGFCPDDGQQECHHIVHIKPAKNCNTQYDQ